MQQWSDFFILFGLSQSANPGFGDILGISNNASRSDIDLALKNRRKLIANADFDQKLADEFDKQVLVPAYVAACNQSDSAKSAADDNIEDTDLVSSDRHIVSHSHDDYKIDQNEYLDLDKTDSSDSAIPFLEPLDDDDLNLDNADSVTPILLCDNEPVQTDQDQLDTNSDPEDNIPDSEAVPLQIVDEKEKPSHNRFMFFLLIAIPLLSLTLLLLFLFNSSSDNTQTAEQVSNQQQDETNIDSITPPANPVVTEPKKVNTQDIIANSLPQQYSSLLEKVSQGFSNQNDDIAILQDMIIILQTWQIIAGNIDNYIAFESIINKQQYRSDPVLLVDKQSIAFESLKFLINNNSQNIEFSDDYFKNNFFSDNLAYRNRIIELACLSNNQTIQSQMLALLKDSSDDQTAARIIRALCVWGNYQNQFELLTAINPAKRDISRRILNNLNARYSNVKTSNNDINRFLPYDFTSKDVENSIDWWQANLVNLVDNKTAVYSPTNNLSSKDLSSSEKKALLITAFCRESFILNSILRSSVDLPVISPDLELSNHKHIHLQKAIPESLKNIANGILAVIYHKYSPDNTNILNEINIIRFASQQTDYIDSKLQALARAKELLSYCKIVLEKNSPSDNPDQVDNELSSVRDLLWQALNIYASGPMPNYDRKPYNLNIAASVFIDFELSSQVNTAPQTSHTTYKDLLNNYDSDIHSPEFFQQAQIINDKNLTQENESLALIQLGIKALENHQSWTANALAIDCFRRASANQTGKALLQRVKPDLVNFLMEKPNFFCNTCGNTGFVICPQCNGLIYQRCQTCKGQGQVTIKLEGRTFCPDCFGHGHLPCNACLGSGVISCPDCYDYVTGLDMFLPNKTELVDLQYALNLANLNLVISVSPNK